MKFIQKTFSIFIRIFFLYFLFNLLANIKDSKDFINNLLNEWLLIIVPSISTSYICGVFIFHYPLLSYILFPILKPIYHFENQKSCSLFLISLIIGEPSITKLINNAILQNEISVKEGNRLMRFSSFISPIFLITILDLSTAIIIIISELIINTIIGFFSANNIFTNHVKNKQTFLEIYFNIINDLPKFLLGILTTMIVINLFMYNNPIKPLNIYLEITKGILTLKNHSPSINKFIILQTLVTSTGLAIILQNYWLTKKTKLSFNNYILYRLYAIVLSIIVSLIIYLYFNFNASLTI